jgi:hypothetical protein
MFPAPYCEQNTDERFVDLGPDTTMLIYIYLPTACGVECGNNLKVNPCEIPDTTMLISNLAQAVLDTNAHYVVALYPNVIPNITMLQDTWLTHLDVECSYSRCPVYLHLMKHQTLLRPCV